MVKGLGQKTGCMEYLYWNVNLARLCVPWSRDDMICKAWREFATSNIRPAINHLASNTKASRQRTLSPVPITTEKHCVEVGAGLGGSSAS